MKSFTLRRQVSTLLWLFIAGLILSGLTALPIEVELEYIGKAMRNIQWEGALPGWLGRVGMAVQETTTKYPFLFYGTDWLAFAHLVIAVAFIGPLRDPVKNKWVIEFGIIACAAVIPWALVAGAIRGIPLFWRVTDCLFGIGGGVLLILCYFNIRNLETLKESI